MVRYTGSNRNRSIPRRDYLKLVGGTAALTGLAGCTTGDTEDNGDTEAGPVPEDELLEGFDELRTIFEEYFGETVASYNTFKREQRGEALTTDVFDEGITVEFHYGDEAEEYENLYDTHLGMDTHEQGTYASIDDFLDTEDDRIRLRNDVVFLSPFTVYAAAFFKTHGPLRYEDDYRKVLGGMQVTITDADDEQIITDLSVDAYSEAKQITSLYEEEYGEGSEFEAMHEVATAVVLPNTEPQFDAPEHPMEWNF